MSTWQQLDTPGRPCWELELRHGIRVLIYGPAVGRELQQYVIVAEVVQASGSSTFLGRATSSGADGLAEAKREARRLMRQFGAETIEAMGEAG